MPVSSHTTLINKLVSLRLPRGRSGLNELNELYLIYKAELHNESVERMKE
jgi:hypothetical protein